MFDSFSFGGETVHSTSNVTIHEHRAPTDDSVKLLKEFEEKAGKKILMTGVVSNVLEAQFVVYGSEFFPMRRVLKIGFKLNGEEYHTSVDLPSTLSLRDKTTDIIKEVVETVAWEITCKLLQNMDKAQMHIMYNDIEKGNI